MPFISRGDLNEFDKAIYWANCAVCFKIKSTLAVNTEQNFRT